MVLIILYPLTKKSLPLLHERRLSNSGIIPRNSLAPVRAASISAVLGDISTFETAIVDSGGVAYCDLRCHIILPVTSLDTMCGYDDVKETWCNECTYNENHNHVHKHKAVDERGVVRVLDEKLGVRK